ncbi:nucleotide exchange factor GrpE [Conchiformibius kuhniae]|uniref:Protein GrpE n=1 Tax=Conchiformibius kuhniae TaxID=211502 RepID=A0A8T9MUL5_9NEIS|nr:nucleotide exchange factor GrpE [Conchiformibius kuhniae]UOP04535.1 nucleotide exchange factor GrpE [Conchiformibius kuhniae]
MSEQTQNPEAAESENDLPAEPTAEELQERIAELEASLQDEQLRGLANEQNLRRRFAEELQNAHKFAAQKFAAEMLVVKDYLEMALADASGNFDMLQTGVSMTLGELTKAFDSTGIKEIPAQAGDKPDPHRHQEMQSVASAQEAGTIVAVLKKGYTLHERVLRPSMVTVAKAAETDGVSEAAE